MDETAKPKDSKLKKVLINLAHSPVKLRVVLSLVLLGAWFLGIEMPRADEIDRTSSQLTHAKDRLETAREIERLRKQVARFEDRIRQSPDPKEWVQYMLAGTRQLGVTITSLDSSVAKQAGPFRVIVIKMSVDGTFREVETLLRWLESNRRLLRVDTLTITPASDKSSDRESVRVNLVVLGMSA